MGLIDKARGKSKTGKAAISSEMPLFLLVSGLVYFAPRYFPFARLSMTITFVIRGSYSLNEQSCFRLSVECHVTQA